jgi:hypothetical protein
VFGVRGSWFQRVRIHKGLSDAIEQENREQENREPGARHMEPEP